MRKILDTKQIRSIKYKLIYYEDYFVIPALTGIHHWFRLLIILPGRIPGVGEDDNFEVIINRHQKACRR
jgi:hypothetical protein